MKLDFEKEFPQPGLDFLRKIVASTGIDPSQADVLLRHLDSQNYTFISHAIAKNSAQTPSEQAQNLAALLQAAVQFTASRKPEIDQDSSPVVSQTLNELSFKEQQFLYEDFSAEFAAEQDTNAANYQLPTGESNPFLDYVYQHAQSEAKSQLGQIWSKFTSPATAEAEAGIAAAATAGGVAGTVIASKISVGTALIPTSTTTIAGATAAIPPAQILGFGLNSNIASSVIGQEYLSFGVFQSVPGEAVASTFGSAAQPGMSYFALTPKGISLAATNPKLANVVKYVSSSPEVTTFAASGVTTTGTKVASAAAAKTAAGTAVKGATQLATRAATQTAVTAAGAEAGATAGSVVPIIGTIIGAIVGFVLGAVVGNWSKVKKEAEEGILALSAAVYLIGSSVFSGSVAAIGAIFAAVSTVAVESAGAIVIIVLSIPIVVAFFLYIITNSAYLVPPSSTVFVPGGPGGGVFENRSSCPIVDGYIGTFSYDSVSETGHGSNPYWGSAASACSLHIPADGQTCGPTVGPNNYCSDTRNWDNGTCSASDPNDHKSPFYGYAIDVYSQAGSAAYATVSFPLINGNITTWNYVGEIGMPASGTRGKAYLFTTTNPDTGQRLDVAFIHLVALSSPPTGLQSGQVLGQVYPATIFRPHVHLELQIDGVYAKPENYFCS